MTVGRLLKVVIVGLIGLAVALLSQMGDGWVR